MIFDLRTTTPWGERPAARDSAIGKASDHMIKRLNLDRIGAAFSDNNIQWANQQGPPAPD